MVFSSNVFLFLFLPIFLGLYYLCPNRGRNLLILIGSYTFYAWWRVDFLLLFAAVTLWNYLFGLRIQAHAGTQAARRWVAVGVIGNLATLGYFKYANFGADVLVAVLEPLGINTFTLEHIILPLGISFYVFQALSYIVDIYRRNAEPTDRFVDFAAYIALFPQLIAGPILRYSLIDKQLKNRSHSLELFSLGACRFMLGFIKKVLIADSLAPMNTLFIGGGELQMADAWFGLLVSALQLYFDFSGYSDMAIGLGLMMGFRFMENFNQPYISQSITEFWRRWHISLSTWLRDYLYVPLGGNRHGTFNTYRNLFLTMLLGGFWHGANWTFLIWGAWHGTWLAIERALGVKAAATQFNLFKWAFTLLLVMLGWVIFRAENLEVAGRMYAALFAFDDWRLSELTLARITGLQMSTLLLAWVVIALCGARQFLAGRRHAPGMTLAGAGAALQAVDMRTVALRGALLLLFCASLLKLSAQSYSPFLYFQF